MPADPYQIIQTWFSDLFTRGEVEKVAELVTADFVSRDPSGKAGPTGPEAFKSWLRGYLAMFSDAEWVLHEALPVEDKIVVRYSGRTTYRGGLFDIPSSGQRVTEMGILIFRIREGKVCELWSALSDLELVLELGAVPTIPSGS